jgi:hypothetical protein
VSGELICTREACRFFETHPGQYVPRPMRLRLDRGRHV